MATAKSKEKTAQEMEGWVEEAQRTEAHDFEADAEMIGVFDEVRTVEIVDEETGEIRASRFYEFHDPQHEDIKMGVWGSGLLDYKADEMGGFKAGTLYRIVYDGKKDIGNGRSARQYRIFSKA